MRFIFSFSFVDTILFWSITLESITIHEICYIDNSANMNNCKACTIKAFMICVSNLLECNTYRSVWGLNYFWSTPFANMQLLLDETDIISFHSFKHFSI